MTKSAGSLAMACFSEQLAEEPGPWRGTTVGRRDKRGSPVEPQAIDMAWVPACRSVGARAAPNAFTSSFNAVFGTVRRSVLVGP
jgi:hypothetical protein